MTNTSTLRLRITSSETKQEALFCKISRSKMASNTEIPSGYDYEFVHVVPDDNFCSICQLVMRNPVQTKCGHRFCRDCLDETMKRKRQCPVDRKTLTLRQIFEDAAWERQILSFKIKCPEQGCTWQGELRNIQEHTKECPQCPVSCPNNCEKNITRQQVTSHTSTECPLTIIPCNYQNIGCTFQVKRKDLNEHIENHVKQHLTIAVERILSLEKQMIGVKELLFPSIQQMAQMNDMHCSFTWKIEDFSQQLETAKQSGRDIQLHSEPFYTHKYGYKLKLRLYPNGEGESKGTHVSVFLIVMRGDYDAMLTWPFDWKVKFILVDQKPNPSQRKNIEWSYIPETFLQNFQRPATDENTGYGCPQFVSHETITTENYVVDDTLFLKAERKPQQVDKNPPTMTKDDDMHYSYVWKVNDFSQQLKAARQSGRHIQLHSEPFYTHKYGYKLKLRLYPNGEGDSKGTHISVYLVVMRGDYDAMLTWPFDWKVKFILVDQKPNPSQRRNIEVPKVFLPNDLTLVSYQRPTTDENNGIGYTQFVSYETLATQKYVVDGTLFLKLELKKP